MPRGDPWIRRELALPDYLWQGLGILARRHGKTRSQLIREAIRLWILIDGDRQRTDSKSSEASAQLLRIAEENEEAARHVNEYRRVQQGGAE